MLFDVTLTAGVRETYTVSNAVTEVMLQPDAQAEVVPENPTSTSETNTCGYDHTVFVSPIQIQLAVPSSPNQTVYVVALESDSCSANTFSHVFVA